MNARYFTNFVFCSLIAATASLPASEEYNMFYDDRGIKREVEEVKNRLSAVEGLLNAHKVQLVVLESENASLKGQLIAVQEGLYNFDEHSQRLDATEELGRVLTKYANNADCLPPLLYAAKIGDVETVRLLIENGADIHTRCQYLFSSPVDYFTPLILAARFDQLEVAELLLSLGVDVNKTAELNSRSALAYAAEFGSAKLVRLLIENGAELNNSYPCRKPDLSNPGCCSAPLHAACKTGNYDAIVALIKAGADVNGGCKTPFQCRTPLDETATKLKYSDNPKNLELVKFLVEKGALRKDRNNSPCPVINAYLQSVGR